MKALRKKKHEVLKVMEGVHKLFVLFYSVRFYQGRINASIYLGNKRKCLYILHTFCKTS